MKTTLKEKKVTIIFKGGSRFQDEMLEGSLRGLLKAWKTFYEQRHKKNEIQIRFTRDHPFSEVTKECNGTYIGNQMVVVECRCKDEN